MGKAAADNRNARILPAALTSCQIILETGHSASWMNLVEIFFGIITRKAIRRGTFTSVADLIRAIRIFIGAWNQRCQPFQWTKTPEQVLTKPCVKPLR